jgi:hypothetical protein
VVAQTTRTTDLPEASQGALDAAGGQNVAFESDPAHARGHRAASSFGTAITALGASTQIQVNPAEQICLLVEQDLHGVLLEDERVMEVVPINFIAYSRTVPNCHCNNQVKATTSSKTEEHGTFSLPGIWGDSEQRTAKTMR